MHSLSFNPDIDIYELSIQLFKDLYDEEGEPIKDLDFTLEMYENAAAGRINFKEKFNLQGYIVGCRKNERLAQSKRRKKHIHLMQSENDTDGGIAVSKVQDTRDDYEKILDADELKYTIAKFKEVSRVWSEDFGVDLIEIIRDTLHMLSASEDKEIEKAEDIMKVTNAMSRIKDIAVKHPDIGEILYVLLSADISFEEMFPSREGV